jgi:hypothetical protein
MLDFLGFLVVFGRIFFKMESARFLGVKVGVRNSLEKQCFWAISFDVRLTRVS